MVAEDEVDPADDDRVERRSTLDEAAEVGTKTHVTTALGTLSPSDSTAALSTKSRRIELPYPSSFLALLLVGW